MPVAPVGVDVAPTTPGMLAASHRAPVQAGGPSTFGRWFAQQFAATQTASNVATTSPALAATSPSNAGSQDSMKPTANLSNDSAFSAETRSEERKTNEPANDGEQDARLSAASVPAQDAVTQGSGDAAPPSARFADAASSTHNSETGVSARPAASSGSRPPAVPVREAAPAHSRRMYSGSSSASAAASVSVPSSAHVVTNTPQTHRTGGSGSPLPERPASSDASSADSLRADSAAASSRIQVAPTHTIASSDADGQFPAPSTASPSGVQAARPAAATNAADPVHAASTPAETSSAGEAALRASVHGSAASASPAAPLGTAVTAAHHQSFSLAGLGASASAASGITPPPAAAWSVTTPHGILSAAEAHPSVTPVSAAHAGDAFERMDTVAAPQVLAGTPQRLSVGVRDAGLGWVEIHTRTSAGEVSAALVTPSAAIHTAISAQLPAIRDYLGGQQVRVDHLTSEQYAASSGGSENSSGNQPQAKENHEPSASAIRSSLTEQLSESERQPLSWIDVRV